MPDVGDNKHIGAVRIEFEPIRKILAQHRRSKGTETLAVFDLRKLPSRNHCTTLSRSSIRAATVIRAAGFPQSFLASQEVLGMPIRARQDWKHIAPDSLAPAPP